VLEDNNKMIKSKSDGYKLAKRFMYSKDIFKLLERLKSVGYGCDIKENDKDSYYKKLGYENYIVVKYVASDNKSILPLYVYYKDRKPYTENDYKHDIQITYSY
jgi:hypothetical protein